MDRYEKFIGFLQVFELSFCQFEIGGEVGVGYGGG